MPGLEYDGRCTHPITAEDVDYVLFIGRARDERELAVLDPADPWKWVEWLTSDQMVGYAPPGPSRGNADPRPRFPPQKAAVTSTTVR